MIDSAQCFGILHMLWSFERSFSSSSFTICTSLTLCIVSFLFSILKLIQLSRTLMLNIEEIIERIDNEIKKQSLREKHKMYSSKRNNYSSDDIDFSRFYFQLLSWEFWGTFLDHASKRFQNHKKKERVYLRVEHLHRVSVETQIFESVKTKGHSRKNHVSG